MKLRRDVVAVLRCGFLDWEEGGESFSAFQEFQRDSSLSVGAQHIGLGHESPIL